MTEAVLLEKSRASFRQAKILLNVDEYEGALYLAGYSLEFMLKRKILLHMKWNKYPLKGDVSKSFKTHKLPELMQLSGLDAELHMDSEQTADWITAQKWSPDWRYEVLPGENLTKAAVYEMFEATLSMVKWIKDKS